MKEEVLKQRLLELHNEIKHEIDVATKSFGTGWLIRRFSDKFPEINLYS